MEVLEVFFDGLLNFGYGVIGHSKSGNGNSFRVHHKLGEVPFDGVDKEPRLFGLEEDKERMRIATIDVDLGEHVEGDIVLGHKLLDLLFGARLLASKLVAGEPQDT